MTRVRNKFLSILLIISLAAGICGFAKERSFTSERSDVTNSLGENIVAEMFIPDEGVRNGKTLIMCHGLTGCRENFRSYAEKLAANGTVVCIFDFRGGGNDCESDGTTLLMTVWTEYDDLTDIYDMVSEKDYVDEDNIYLFGHSQGGLVASLYASDHPDDVAGLILLAPAYNIPDAIRENFPTVYDILPVFPVEDMVLGYFYAYDIYDMDVFDEIKDYDGPVLILHGSEDTVVDLSYSRDALGVYERARLIVVDGCDHALTSDDSKELCYELISSYLGCGTRIHKPDPA
ncbi:MAG: alpha/beta fold hydrolase [Clostridiales bacterium]|nr:alpha/beta fold hydrolase [Clostridiales bacterium]